jgi:hypothetical protein
VNLINNAPWHRARIKAWCPAAAAFSRKRSADQRTAKKLGGKGVIWMKSRGLQSLAEGCPADIAALFEKEDDWRLRAGSRRGIRPPGRQAARDLEKIQDQEAGVPLGTDFPSSSY